ncbi:MAG TPA: hypothetical protein VKB86_14345 [Pyrinomonadaceae bacterium]|nr:hypothetical protein [Pyrinomonadaceae bacterium]
MKANTAKGAITPLVLSASLLCAMTILSVLTSQAQGRHGGESRSSSGGESRSSRSSSSSSSSGQSRSRSDSSRSERRERGRTSDSSSQSSSSNSNSGDDSRSWSRHRDRDRDRHRHRDRDKDRDRNRDRDRDEQARVRRNSNIYRSQNYGGTSYGADAYDRGYQDGLFTGASDARRGQSYDPERSHFYRRGASGFFSSLSYHTTDRESYREGFMRGYEEGYRHYEIYFSGGRFQR